MTRKVLNPINAATVVVLVYMIMPVLSVIISAYITTYAYMLLTVILVLFILLTGGIKRLNNILYLLTPFVIYVGCTFFTNKDSTLLWGYQSLLFLLPVILGYYYVFYRPEAIDLFSKALILFTLVTVVTTIVGLIEFPQASRILATIATSDDAEALKYGWHNIGGYSFIYVCVLLYPVLILAYKLKRINRIVFFSVFIVLLTLIILSEYTTALLLFIISSILFFFSKKLNPKQLFIVGILMFLAVFFLWDMFKNFLLWLADVIDNENISPRLVALSGGVTGIENFEDNRINLYRASINGFFSSPVFGKILGTTTTAGGHSFILDSLANYGILGIIAIIFVYRNIYRFFFKPFSDNVGYGYVLWAFVQAIILSTVNTGMWLNILTFFIPVLLTSIYKKDSEENHEDSLDS